MDHHGKRFAVPFLSWRMRKSKRIDITSVYFHQGSEVEKILILNIATSEFRRFEEFSQKHYKPKYIRVQFEFPQFSLILNRKSKNGNVVNGTRMRLLVAKRLGRGKPQFVGVHPRRILQPKNNFLGRSFAKLISVLNIWIQKGDLSDFTIFDIPAFLQRTFTM